MSAAEADRVTKLIDHLGVDLVPWQRSLLQDILTGSLARKHQQTPTAPSKLHRRAAMHARA